jgi:hypothetical protein
MKKTIHKQLHSKEDLIKSERFAHKVLDASLNGIYIYEVKLGLRTFVNKQCTSLTGYTLNPHSVFEFDIYKSIAVPKDCDSKSNIIS